MKRIFISREINLEQDGGSTKIELLFYQPTRWRTSYKCTYEIRVDRRVVRRFDGRGVDGVQALLLAMSSAIADLDYRFPKLSAAIPKEYLNALRAIR